MKNDNDTLMPGSSKEPMDNRPDSPTKILVIDDEALIRKSIAAYLSDSGFDVLEAGDGPAGIEMVARHDPEVVLLDLRMPGMDGLEVLDRVTGRWPETPVVVVTGAGVLKDAIEAVRLGAFEFISKPIIDMAILEHAVRRAVERRRLRLENRAYQSHLESQVQLRTRDLQRRTSQLEQSNLRLESEMAGRRRTEKALRQSQSQLLDLIALFEGYIYAVDLSYRLGFMNPKLMAATGCQTPQGLCHRVIYNNDAPCPWCPLGDVRQGLTVRRELHSSRDGRWYYGIYTGQTDSRGEVNGCQAIVMDIHERKQAEAQLQNQAHKLEAHNARLRHSLQGAVRFGEIIGKSAAMHSVYDAILKAAESGANVIVYGESGTGKELVAKTIHDLSDRGDKAFVPVNCGAIPDNLFESEFFGYEKGAFTGAEQDKKGFLTAARGGTLFLDEVGEIPANMQVKLLRAIDGGGYTPLGSHTAIVPDIRIVAATNRDLQQLVAAGDFRKDLYYRIHVVPISLPPLRERRNDIPLLIHHFMQLFNRQGQRQSIPAPIMTAMQQYHWPGNVRELQNAVQQYLALEDVDVIAKLSPQPEFSAPHPGSLEEPEANGLALSEARKCFEKRYIEKLLIEHRWHRSKVAAILGIDRRTLFRKINTLGIK
ncbi:MAG: sigma 54-interacting transcriptional regulator [Desulfobacteraceae bacterium]